MSIISFQLVSLEIVRRVVSMLKSTMLSCGQSTIVLTVYHISLVPRPSPDPVFDRLQHPKLQANKNWSRGRPG